MTSRKRRKTAQMLRYKVTLRSDAGDLQVRTNLLIAAFTKLVKGLPDFKVICADIVDAGIMQVLIPECEALKGGVAPGRVSVEVEECPVP